MSAASRLLAVRARRGLTLSVAESCTGGLVSHLLVSVPGASRVFAGGAVAYSPALKERLLGVSPATVERETVVSAAVAEEMARGAAERLSTDVALSVTGVAGPPSPDDPAPCGTVWFGLFAPDGVRSTVRRFPGGRAAVRRAAARFVLRWAESVLAGSAPAAPAAD